MTDSFIVESKVKLNTKHCMSVVWLVCIIISVLALATESHATMLNLYDSGLSIESYEDIRNISKDDVRVVSLYKIKITSNKTEESFIFTPWEPAYVYEKPIFTKIELYGNCSSFIFSPSIDWNFDLYGLGSCDKLVLNVTPIKHVMSWEFGQNSYNISWRSIDNKNIIESNEFYILLDYELPRIVRTKGDFHYVHFGFECSDYGRNKCPKESEITQTLFFSNTSVIDSFPENTQMFELLNQALVMQIRPYDKGVERYQVWFRNMDEIAEKEWHLVKKGALLGIGGGFIASLIISSISYCLNKRQKKRYLILKKSKNNKKDC